MLVIMVMLQPHFFQIHFHGKTAKAIGATEIEPIEWGFHIFCSTLNRQLYSYDRFLKL